MVRREWDENLPDTHIGLVEAQTKMRFIPDEVELEQIERDEFKYSGFVR